MAIPGPESKPPPDKITTGPEIPSGEITSGRGASREVTIDKALHTPVKNIAQLRKVMIEAFGEKKGNELTDSFVYNLKYYIYSQIKHTNERFKKAMKKQKESGG